MCCYTALFIMIGTPKNQVSRVELFLKSCTTRIPHKQGCVIPDYVKSL
jgi:hypothetical protein